MKKLLLILVFVALVVVIGLFFNRSSENKQVISESEKQQLQTALSDPFVVHIRRVIDNFNAGKNEGFSFVELDPYKDYFQSKFVLMEINDNASGGGKDMVIIFVDKPDKVFYVWVYDEAGGRLDLRAFHPLEDVSPEQAQEMYISSKLLIDELGLAI